MTATTFPSKDIMSVMTDNKKSDNWYWVEWLIAERQGKGWTQAELGRRAGTTRQTVNDYESRRRPKPDETILMNISKALDYPPVYLPRLAGLYPAAPNLDEDDEKIVYETQDLTHLEKEEVLAFIRMKKNLRKKK